MTDRPLRLVLAGIVTAVLLAGCIGGTPPTSYYTLHQAERPAAPAAPAAADFPVISIGPVLLPDLLKQSRIATGGDDGRYRLAEYHRWSGELDRDIARTIAEQLSALLGTEQVAVFPWDQHLEPTRRIRLDILAMGGEPGREATLSVRWTVSDPREQVSTTTRRSELREPLTEAGHSAWVRGQQRNFAKLGQELAAVIRALPDGSAAH